MAINKKLIHFKTKQKFQEELAKGNILNTSIVFIQDTTEIYTHGQLYDGSTFDPTDIEASIQNLLNNKVDKVTGKGLSTNDYTTTEKNKLAGIASGAEVNVQSDWNVTDSNSDAYIKNKPTVDTSLSTTSTNAVQNKAVTAGINAKYTKPSTGIPKSDLASAVQTSLGKADTALQSIPSEYITETELTAKGYTTNIGTITGIKMNGASKGTSGVVDLGTVITAHQDISGKLDASVAAATYQPKGNYLQPQTGDGTKYLSNDGTYKEITITSESNVKAVDTTETIDEPQVNTYIKYSQQSLTEDQKNQASTNIGAYRKPSSGIPKTDLSSEVQTALNNATPDAVLSSTSTNSVQNKVLYNVLKEKANTVTVQNRTENIYEISPNILYIWGVKSSLQITLSQNTNTGVYNEYMFQFESGNVPTTLILPSEVKFINGVQIESNKVYQVSIINNIGVIGGVLNV